MEISIKGELAARNIKYIDVAKKVNIPVTTFYKKLKKNSFTISEVEAIAEIIGKKLTLEEK